MTASDVSTDQRSATDTDQPADATGGTPDPPVPPTVRRIVRRHGDPMWASNGEPERGNARAEVRFDAIAGDAARRRIRRGAGV
jgi:hypothetical protein